MLFFSNRRLRFILDIMSERKNLAMVFLGSNESVQEIKKVIQKNGLSNVFTHKQIPRKNVTYYCSQADFGLVYTWNRLWPSYWNAMPNKLMDVSLAGIPVLATSQPELRRFIQEYNNGVTFSGTMKSSFSNAIDLIIKNEDSLKSNALKVKDKVNWTLESEKLIELYRTLLDK